MTDKKCFRIFATSRIGDAGENYLRESGYDLEVFQGPEAPQKKLIIAKVKSGIDRLITTLRDLIYTDICIAARCLGRQEFVGRPLRLPGLAGDAPALQLSIAAIVSGRQRQNAVRVFPIN